MDPEVEKLPKMLVVLTGPLGALRTLVLGLIIPEAVTSDALIELLDMVDSDTLDTLGFDDFVEACLVNISGII